MEGLTTNEIAQCQSAVQINMSWWREKGKSDYAKEQLAALGELNTKLDRILNEALPKDDQGETDYGGADEPLLVPVS
ncbi:MAG: hypothetical protein ACPG4X_14785 [Pikeienuella sp.]